MRVLIIDDDKVDREDIKRVLQSQKGTVIDEAATAQEGLAALTNIKFDIVLLDYLLPDKDGLNVLSDIKKLNLTYPCGIILMSGNEEGELLEKALESGAQDFLVKHEISQQRLKRTIHLARKRFELEYHVRKSQERSKLAARMDNLTRLYNRTAFESSLEKMLSSDASYGEGAVIFLDVDNFKFFNECYGHEVGDGLLKQVAERIKQVIDKNDKIARIGSNEFAILLQSENVDSKKRRLLNRLLKALDAPFVFDDVEINCTFSIGSTCVGDKTSKKDVIKQANLALHKAKGESGYSVTEFDASLSAEIEKHRKIKEGLEYHLSQGEFNVVYQPIVRAVGETVSLEALVRWPTDSPFGHFRPDEFIAISEQNQTIDKLGEFVFKQAVETLAGLKKKGFNDIRVSVNFSPIQLNQWELCVKLVDICTNAGVLPSSVILEITETALLSNDFATKRMISELAAAGFTISLDDFGTGYSSISHLINFPINQVKMDRSVVPVSHEDDKRKNLLSSLVSMCKSIGAIVVVEGIEHQWQADFCHALGAEKQQGYLYSKPVSEKELYEVYLQPESEDCTLQRVAI